LGARVNVHPFSRLRAVLTVLRAFPCRSRLGDAETAATVEEEVRGRMATGHLWVRGRRLVCTQLSWLLRQGA